MNTSQRKFNAPVSFSLKKAIDLVVSTTCANRKLICSYKSNLPKELMTTLNKFAIERLISKLINSSFLSYQEKSVNKIILINVGIDNESKVTISVTCGGKSISFLQKKLIEQKNLVLMEDCKNTEVYSIARIVIKELAGKIRIISKPRKGFTIICSFLLN